MAGVGARKRYDAKVMLLISKEILDRLADLAEQDDRSIASYVRTVLKNHIEEIDEQVND